MIANGVYTYFTVEDAVVPIAANPETRRSWSVYNAAGQLYYQIDAENAVTKMFYDVLGNVRKSIAFANTRVTNALPTAASMDVWAENQDTVSSNRVTRSYRDLLGRIVFAADGEGYITKYEYDAAGRVLRTLRYDTPLVLTDSSTLAAITTELADDPASISRVVYDERGRVLDSFDARGVRTRYDYAANGNLTAQTVAYGSPEAVTTAYLYDDAGRMISETVAAGTALAAETRYAYDGLGNLVRVTDPDGNSTYTYHVTLPGAAGKPERRVIERDAAGGVTETGYNAFGEVAWTVRKAKAAANPASVDSLPTFAVYDPALDARTTYQYDKMGRVSSVRDAENYDTVTEYNAFGDIKSVRRGSDLTTFPYDREGRLVSETDAGNEIRRFAINAFGENIETANGPLTTTSVAVQVNIYDRRGLLKQQNTAIRSADTPGAADIVERYTYDARGNLTAIVKAFGLPETTTTRNIYSRTDQLVEMRYPAVFDDTNTNLVYPEDNFEYDARGNMIEKIDQGGARTLFYYDALDRLIGTIDALGAYTTVAYTRGAGVDGGAEITRSYNLAVTVPTNAGGPPPQPPTGGYRETVRAFDKLGRLAATGIYGAVLGRWNGSAFDTSGSTIHTSVSYDTFGNVVATKDAQGVLQFSYFDRLGRMTAQLDRANYLTTWRYDADGNVEAETRFATAVGGTVTLAAPPTVAPSADDRTTIFTYDANGRRTSETRVQLAYSTIADNGVLVGTNAAATTGSKVQYQYTGLGEVKLRSEANGDAVSYEYDTAGRLIKETRAGYKDQADNLVVPTLRYTYDGLGNVTSMRQGGASESAADRITTYVYGPGGRLRSMTDAAGFTRHYDYDIAGRVVRERYDRVVTIGTAAISEADIYEYDVLGRLRSQTHAKKVGTAWTFDVADGNDTRTVLRYNVFGELVGKGVNAVTLAVPMYQETIVYDNVGRIERSNAGDGVWRAYLYDANGNQTLTLSSTGADLSGVSMAALKASLTATGGTTMVGAVTTITSYDARGQAIMVREPDRQLSTVALPQTIERTTGYTAFGEVAWESNARIVENNSTVPVTTYSYNTMGRRIRTTSPVVNITAPNGATTPNSPFETYTYDQSGRLIASTDANGHVTKRLLLAGTGHGGTEALVAKEFRPDSGVGVYGYDVFGDQRRSTQVEGLTLTIDQSFDAMGRLTQAVRRFGQVEYGTDYYRYDGLGQRIRHTTSGRDASDAEETRYDSQGRVTQTRAFGGDVTKHDHKWEANSYTHPIGLVGGWTVWTTHANDKRSLAQSDVFGRLVYTYDMGQHGTVYYYDRGGRLIKIAGYEPGTEATDYDRLNTGLVGKVTRSNSEAAARADTATHTATYRSVTETYGYDADGRKTSERSDATRGDWVDNRRRDDESGVWYRNWKFVLSDTVQQEATATYDALGRMTRWAEAGGGATPAASLDYRYDAVGNVRSETVRSGTLDAQGASVGAVNPVPVERWYRYDAMNRMTRSGVLSGGNVVRDAQGIDIVYRADGQRAYTDRTVGTGLATREFYGYNDPGQLKYVHRLDGATDANGVWAGPSVYHDMLDQQAYYAYDALGRLTEQVDYAWHEYDYDSDGTATPQAVIIRRGATRPNPNPNQSGLVFDPIVYDGAGRVTRDEVTTRKADGTTLVTTTDYTYGTGSDYELGALVSSTATTTNGGAWVNTVTTDNTHGWYDGAVLTGTTVTTVSNGTSQTTHTTSNTLSETGAVITARITDGRPRTVSFAHDAAGRIVRRGEADQLSGGDPHAIWYRFDGREIGTIGNDGATDASYDASIDTRRTSPGTGAFRSGAVSGVGYARFGQGFDTVSSFAQGAEGGRYTVQSGDTLASVAQALWGDANLWYKLAQANGLGADSNLIAGQSLTIPAGVMRTANSSSSTKPYDAADLLGDLSPTTPAPQAVSGTAKKNKCGVFGQILLVAIAVAVTIWASPVGSATFLQGALAGAAGLVASKGVGLATGVQEKFSPNPEAVSSPCCPALADATAAEPSRSIKPWSCLRLLRHRRASVYRFHSIRI